MVINVRTEIARNKKMTALVIFCYILIMIAIGLLADVVLFGHSSLSLTQNLYAFATFKFIPYATIVTLGLALIGITWIRLFGHKMMLMGIDAHEITQDAAKTNEEQMILNIVEEMSISAGLNYVPKVYWLNTPEMNAFAAGWTERNAIVGVTSGLVDSLNRAELQSVIAHEIGHVINGDSRLTLYVGILANVILTVTNLFWMGRGRGNSKSSNQAAQILLILNIVLPIVTQILYLFLSRKREYMADATAVKLTDDNESMISALRKISKTNVAIDAAGEEGADESKVGRSYRQAAYIYSKGDSWFSTHPSIENRIKVLQGGKIN